MAAKIEVKNNVVKIDGSAMNQAAGAEKVNGLMFRINAGLLEVSANSGTSWSKVAMSPADILTAVKTVDGVGSGLDADLVDGLSTASSATASTVMTRDANGDTNINNLNATTSIKTGNWRLKTDATTKSLNFIYEE